MEKLRFLKEVHYRDDHSKCRGCLLLETFKHNLTKQTVPDHLKMFGIYFLFELYIKLYENIYYITWSTSH